MHGAKAVNFIVQIPLTREAIQAGVIGPATRVEMLEDLLRQILEGLNGESNWLVSIAPEEVAGWMVMLCLGIAGVIADLACLWLLSKRSPKGTVFVIATAFYTT